MKRIVYFVIIFIAFILGTVQPAFALDKAQRFEIERTPWFDKTDCYGGSGGAGGGGGGATGGANSGKVYFLGDSIGAGAQAALNTAFNAKGLTPVEFNSVPGRNLQGTPPSPDGLAALAADESKWTDAKVVVFELGTNTNGFTAANIKAATALVKNKNSNAKIFWVNSFRTDTADKNAGLNVILTSTASEGGYTVIDWFSKVKDKVAEYLGTDNAHPNATGSPVWVSTIVDAVASGGSATPVTTSSGSGGCGCTVSGGGGSTNLTGNTNVEKAFNFFVSQGLTPAQSAGIVGNLMVESGPNIDPAANNEINGGHHGIAQWDKLPGGRYDKLKAFAVAHGVSNPEDLGIQLQFLWQEMPSQSGGRRIDATTAVKATSTPEDAAVAFEEAFERSGGSGNDLRIKHAKDVFTSFGSNSPTPTGGTPATPTTAGGSCSGGGGSDSTIDPTLPQGSRQELFDKIKATGKITANVDLLGVPQMKATILAVILKLTEKYTFAIGSTYRNDGGPHSTGGAVDLGNINGQGVPTGEDYEGFNQIAADFIKDAATVNPGGAGAYIGVPNERFKAIEEPIITGKGGTTLIETRANGLAQGAHFHINVSTSAP